MIEQFKKIQNILDKMIDDRKLLNYGVEGMKWGVITEKEREQALKNIAKTNEMRKNLVKESVAQHNKEIAKDTTLNMPEGLLRGLEYENQGKYDKAIEEYKKVGGIEGTWHEAHLLEKIDEKKSLEVYKKLTLIEAKTPEEHDRKSQAYYKLKDYKNANVEKMKGEIIKQKIPLPPETSDFTKSLLKIIEHPK